MTDIYSAADAAKATFQALMEQVSGTKEINLSTGFDRLDSHLYGFQPGKVTVLASQPSIGKTAYALNIVRNMLHKDSTKSLLYCSSDLDHIQLLLRFFCIECGLEASKLLQGELCCKQNLQEITSAGTWIKDLPLWINPSCGISVEELKRKIRRFQKKHPLDLIIIDSLELLKYQEPSTAVKTIRQIAKEYQLPILLLTTCYGKNKRCQLHDLPDGIVDNSDTIMFLERERKQMTDGEKAPAELIIARNTCGFTGTIPMEYEVKTMIFSEVNTD